MTRLCYISRRYPDRLSAGNKAKSDYEDILASMGAVNLGLKRSYGRGKAATFFLNLAGVARMAANIRSGDVILLQYPVKKYFSLICRIARMRGAATVAFIHDLGSFRRKKLTPAKEIKRLRHADRIIAATDAMRDWLLGHNIGRPVDVLGLHDFLSDATPPCTPTASATPRIIYAGSLNLRKNSFLLQSDKFTDGITLTLFGNMSADEQKLLPAGAPITYRGFMPADKFIATAASEGDFGLVWDGERIDTCSGDFGEYLAVNAPHKASLYVRAGLPLIVWSGAAIAPIVIKKGIGISVNSLEELPKRIAALSDGERRSMNAAVRRMAAEMAQGHAMKSAIARTMAEIKK